MLVMSSTVFRPRMSDTVELTAVDEHLRKARVVHRGRRKPRAAERPLEKRAYESVLAPRTGARFDPRAVSGRPAHPGHTPKSVGRRCCGDSPKYVSRIPSGPKIVFSRYWSNGIPEKYSTRYAWTSWATLYTHCSPGLIEQRSLRQLLGHELAKRRRVAHVIPRSRYTLSTGVVPVP